MSETLTRSARGQSAEVFSTTNRSLSPPLKQSWEQEVLASLLTAKQHPWYNFDHMAPEISKPLETTMVQAAYKPQELPPHERFGEGQRYRFGSTLADVYSDPPELTPVVQIRMVKGYLAVSDVLHVLPTEAGGLHVDHANGACEIGKTGDLALVYTAPKPEMLLRESRTGHTRKDVYGRSYTQSSLEVEGTPEGVRVALHGVVDAAPKPVNTKRGSPFQIVADKVITRNEGISLLYPQAALIPHLASSTAYDEYALVL